MTVLFSDSGTGTNESPLATNYSTLTPLAGLRRVSNQFANITDGTDSAAYVDTITTPNDQYCQVEIAVVGASDGGPMVRASPGGGGGNGVFCTAFNASDIFAISMVNGSFGVEDNDAGTYTVGAVIYLEAQGSAYVSKKNGTTVNSFTFAGLSSGDAGMFIYDGALRLVNLEVGDFNTTTNYTLPLAQGSYSLSGQAVALKAGRKMPAAQGSYSLNGQSVGLNYSGAARALSAAQGSYSLSGQGVGLGADRKIQIAQGSYALSGQVVALKPARRLSAAQGSYALTGQSVALSYSGAASTYTFSMAQGSYNLIGSDAAADYAISIGSGSYALNGQSVGLKLGRKTSAAQGSYALSGQALTIRVDRRMSLAQGSYALNGQAVGLDQHAPAPRLTVVSGSYSLSGIQVNLLYSGNRGDIFHSIPLNWWTKGL
jgi:hypothetical protein